MKTLEDDFIWLFPLSTKGEKINSSCSKRNRNERRKKFWSCQVRTFESYRIEITPDWWKVDPPLWNQAERHSELWKSFSPSFYSSCCSVAKSSPTLCNPMNFNTPDPLSSTVSQSLLKFMSIESVILSNHLILCCPLLLPSVFPSIKAFSNEY